MENGGFINETLQWKGGGGDMSFAAKFQGYANTLCSSMKRANLNPKMNDHYMNRTL
jgi:hypothetical protein